ncbi:MAG: glycosyltransferase family 4 protein, partial [Gemmatimonadales bacterium]
MKGVIAGSDGAGELVRAAAKDVPIAVMPQLGAAPPHEPLHTPHEGLAIVYIGRLVAWKGLDNLLQALALHRGTRWHLTVVGDGPERERLEEMASELRLAARVRWLGGLPAEDVDRLWPDLDVLVQPSRAFTAWRETNGYPLTEAMAHELAVVGTQSGVLPELIGDAGIVVPPGDVPALAEAVERLGDADVRMSLAAAARARALRLYSDDAIAERTLEFWRQLIT